MADEYEEKIKRILHKGEPIEETEDSQGVASPLPQLEGIIQTARDLSKRYGLILPPPFAFDFPRLPAAREERNTVEKLPKVEEPKVQEDPKITCPKCKSTNSLTAKFCSTCGWDLNKQFRVDPGFTLRK